jgi:hypothetical protein
MMRRVEACIGCMGDIFSICYRSNYTILVISQKLIHLHTPGMSLPTAQFSSGSLPVQFDVHTPGISLPTAQFSSGHYLSSLVCTLLGYHFPQRSSPQVTTCPVWCAHSWDITSHSGVLRSLSVQFDVHTPGISLPTAQFSSGHYLSSLMCTLLGCHFPQRSSPQVTTCPVWCAHSWDITFHSAVLLRSLPVQFDVHTPGISLPTAQFSSGHYLSSLMCTLLGYHFPQRSSPQVTACPVWRPTICMYMQAHKSSSFVCGLTWVPLTATGEPRFSSVCSFQ